MTQGEHADEAFDRVGRLSSDLEDMARRGRRKTARWLLFSFGLVPALILWFDREPGGGIPIHSILAIAGGGVGAYCFELFRQRRSPDALDSVAFSGLSLKERRSAYIAMWRREVPADTRVVVLLDSIARDVRASLRITIVAMVAASAMVPVVLSKDLAGAPAWVLVAIACVPMLVVVRQLWVLHRAEFVLRLAGG